MLSKLTVILCILTDSQAYSIQYASCRDAFVRGKIHPEPGNPVQILLQDQKTLVNCTMENIYSKKQSCPNGWYGDATHELCFQVNLQTVTNQEACR